MIDVNDDAEMARLIQALADDIGSASIHWRMYSDLLEATNSFDRVSDQMAAFWSLTLQAHNFAAVSYLSRAYETDRRGLHLGNWLMAIQRHPELFAEELDRPRLTLEPPAAETALAVAEPALGADVLAEDIRRCSSRGNPLVQKLLYYRNNLVAHPQAGMAQSGGVVAEDQLLTDQEFQALIDQGMDILNRYSRLFDAPFQTRDVLAGEGFDYLFRTAQAQIAPGLTSAGLPSAGLTTGTGPLDGLSAKATASTPTALGSG